MQGGVDQNYINNFMKEINEIAEINDRSGNHLTEKRNDTIRMSQGGGMPSNPLPEVSHHMLQQTSQMPSNPLPEVSHHMT